jgi:hypothetical protein
MQEHLDLAEFEHTRIEARTPASVPRKFVPPGSTHTETCITLSHIAAIRRASAHSIAIVLEDDADMKDLHLKNLNTVLATTPEDVECVQLCAFGEDGQAICKNTRGVVAWEHGFYGTVGYLITQIGMHRINAIFGANDPVFSIQGSFTMIADHILYASMNTVASRKRLIRPRNIPSTRSDRKNVR